MGNGDRQRERESWGQAISFINMYFISQNSHPISQNLVTWPCLVSYKTAWAVEAQAEGVHSSLRVSNLKGQGRALEIINKSLPKFVPLASKYSFSLFIPSEDTLPSFPKETKFIQLLYPAEKPGSLGEVQPLYQFRCGSGDASTKRWVLCYTVLSWKGQKRKHLAESRK